MAELIINFINIIVTALLCSQWGSVFLFLIIEWSMVDYYRYGTFEKPRSIFEKILNVVMDGILGSGYFLYRKFEKYNWITRKILMLISLVVHGILCIIIYFIIMKPLEWIFL